MPLLPTYRPLTRSARTHACQAAIDFGAHSAKVVLGDTGDQAARDHSGHADVLPGDPDQPPGAAARHVAEWLSHWCSERLSRVACSLPSAITDYEVASLPSNELSTDSAAAEAMRQMLGESLKNVCWDSWRTPDLSGNASGDSLHLVWSPAGETSQIARELMLKQAPCERMQPAIVPLAGIAPDDDRLRLVVDLAHSSSMFVIVNNGQPQYARRNLGESFGELTARVAAAMDVRRPSAESLLEDWGCVRESGPIAGQISDCCEQWLQAVGYEVDRTLSYVDHVTGGRRVEQVMLCGGGAAMRGLSDWLAERVETPTGVAPVPEDVQWSAALPYNASFAQALSLAAWEGRQ